MATAEELLGIGSPPKKRGAKPVPAPIPKSRDAILTVTLEMPGYPKETQTLRIGNILGNTVGSQRVPVVFWKNLKELLRGRYPTIT